MSAIPAGTPLSPSPFLISHPFRFVGGLPCLEDEGRRLAVDTGSSRSRWAGGPVRWGSRRLSPPSGIGFAEGAALSARLGSSVDGVIGGDVLCQEPFGIDVGRGLLVVGGITAEEGAIALPMELPLGVPLVRLSVGRRTVPLLLDTGAVRSYLPPAALLGFPLAPAPGGLAPEGDGEPREPRDVTFRVGGAEVTLSVSLVSASHRGRLPFGGRVGILGMEILRHFPRIAFDYRGGAVLFSRGGEGR